ncbi:calmodulin-like isoform X2 [Littorina saxatilis]
MSQDTQRTYFRAEFQSMGDVLGDGRLNKQEFTRLVSLLGLPDAATSAEVLWNKTAKQEGGKMRIEEYCDLMADPAVDSKTDMWRKLFAKFDTDGSGYASRQDVIEGLENIGIPVNDEMKAKIKAMDSDRDGRIYYGDFLKMQLLKK